MLAFGFVHRDGVWRQLPQVREELCGPVVAQQKHGTERAQADGEDNRGIERPAH